MGKSASLDRGRKVTRIDEIIDLDRLKCSFMGQGPNELGSVCNGSDGIEGLYFVA